jgi:hypothetical protein
MIDNVDISVSPLEAILGVEYEQVKFNGRIIKLIKCTYCGDTNVMTRDHPSPVCSSGKKRMYAPWDTVPCCSECNSLLGAYPVRDINNRCAYLFGKYAKKYSSLLSTADFSEDELDNLGYNLSKMVIASINQRDFIRSKLDCLSIRAELLVHNRDLQLLHEYEKAALSIKYMINKKKNKINKSNN